MKKTLLALAIAGLSANAVAVDLDATDYKNLVVAQEMNLNAKGNYSLDASVNTAANVDFATQQVLNENDTILVTYEFSDNAKVVAAGAKIDGIALTPTASTDNTLTFDITFAAGVTVAKGAAVELDVTSYEVSDAQPVSVKATLQKVIGSTSVTQYEKTRTVFAFDSVVSPIFDIDTVNTDKVDVSTESKFFTKNDGSDLTSEIGTAGYELEMYDMGGVADVAALDSEFEPAVLTDVVESFTVQLDSTATLAGYKTVKFGTSELVVSEEDPSLAGTKSGTVYVAPATFQVAVAADNDKVIEVSEMSAILTPKSTDYTLAATNTAELNAIVKNGSQDGVNFLNAPGSTYPGFIRITNDSSLAGNVYVTVIRDNGESASFPLDAAYESASLEPQSSTTLISSEALVSAAGWTDVAATEKLRVEVDGEFMGGQGVIVESFSLSTDNNSFSKN